MESNAPCLIEPALQGGYELDAVITLACPLDEVFDFFSRPHNLEKMTPPWMSFAIVTPEPIAMCAGLTVDCKLKVHGLHLRWRSLISVWDPPHLFVDEQVRGPYRKWHHRHSFEARGEHTVVRDHVHFQVPGGALVYHLAVRRDVTRIFTFRHHYLADRFGVVS